MSIADTQKNIRLTQTVKKGGCAAKVAATELRKILAQVRFPPDPPDLLIGTGTFDDAAIFRVNEDCALVQTLDFFTPIVDSPRTFGKIAAANALSDVYAMGGRPVTAMSILAFPVATMDPEVVVELLQGASDVIAESGASLVGGHTIDDDTLKFGLSVTGFVHPLKIWSNAGARPGDLLVLTKALGTGTLTAALKREAVTESQIQDGIDSMCLLNNVASLISTEVFPHIHGATDITGFGLAGHAFNLAKSSGVSLEIDSSLLPAFDRAREFIGKDFLTKAHVTNRQYTAENLVFDSVDEISQELFFDPQTSGGLLLAVHPEFAERLIREILPRFKSSRVIGKVLRKSDLMLRFF